MVAPRCPLVCDRVGSFFWWCGFLPVGTWRILLCTVRSQCSFLATGSVETLRRWCCLFLGVLRSVSRGSVIQFLALVLAPWALLVSIPACILLAVFSLPGYRTSAPFLLVGCFALGGPSP